MSISSSETRNDEKGRQPCVEKCANETLTPIKAIRAYCLGCCYGSANEVRLCPIKDCELYPYREGHDPRRKRTMTEEQKARLIEAGRKYREARNGQP